jgi:putative transposase
MCEVGWDTLPISTATQDLTMTYEFNAGDTVANDFPKPCVIRCDNGPEYISETTKNWAKKHVIDIAFIQPGQPQQNAYVERYNRTVRYDWLAHHLFESLDEIQDFAARWLWTYNHERPNMALGGITPKQKLALAA